MILKTKFERAVNAVFVKHDPTQLISGGAPDDEYTWEIQYFLPLIEKYDDPKILGEKIREDFLTRFQSETLGSVSVYQEIAKELLELKRLGEYNIIEPEKKWWKWGQRG